MSIHDLLGNDALITIALIGYMLRMVFNALNRTLKIILIIIKEVKK